MDQSIAVPQKGSLKHFGNIVISVSDRGRGGENEMYRGRAGAGVEKMTCTGAGAGVSAEYC